MSKKSKKSSKAAEEMSSRSGSNWDSGRDYNSFAPSSFSAATPWTREMNTSQRRFDVLSDANVQAGGPPPQPQENIIYVDQEEPIIDQLRKPKAKLKLFQYCGLFWILICVLINLFLLLYLFHRERIIIQNIQTFSDLRPGHQLISTTTTSSDLGDVRVGRDGYPIFMFISTAGTVNQLLIRHCQDLACIGYTTYTVEASNVVGDFDITVGTDGLPALVYVTSSASILTLRFVKCNDYACSTRTKLDLTTDVLSNSVSMNLNMWGWPQITYIDTQNIVSFWTCRNAGCSLRVNSKLNGSLALFNTSVIGQVQAKIVSATSYVDGTPFGSFSAFDSSALYFWKCFNSQTVPVGVNCSIVEVPDDLNQTILVTQAILFPTVTPVIFYSTPSSLMSVACQDIFCQNTSDPIVLSNTNFAYSFSLSLDLFGYPWLLFLDNASIPNYIRCSEAKNCVDPTPVPIDEFPEGMTEASWVLGFDWFPFVVGRTKSSSIATLHCGNGLCTHR